MSRFNNYLPNILNIFHRTPLSQFMREVFNELGHINKKTAINDELIITIDCHQLERELIDFIKTFQDIVCEEHDHFVIYKNYNALDFLSNIYDNSDARHRNEELYKSYLQWLFSASTPTGFQEVPTCSFIKADPDAVIPFKNRISDVGLDLTAIKKTKDINSVTIMVDTGIIVSPPLGYFSKIYPRSSLVKSGYMLANSVGIIDGTYRDTLKICLVKVDENAPEITFPFKCCQLIFEKQVFMNMEEVTSLDGTTRNLGAFGSTNSITT